MPQNKILIIHPSDKNDLLNASLDEINALEPDLPPVTIADCVEGEINNWEGFVWKKES